MGRDTPYSAQRFRTALAYFLFGKVAQAIALIGFTLVSVRLLSTSEFATYMVFFGLIELARPLVSLGLVPMLQQYLPELAIRATRNDLNLFLRWTLIARGLITVVVVSAIYFWWADLVRWLGLDGAEALPIGLVCAVIAATLASEYSVSVLEALLKQRLAQPIRTLLPLGKLAGLLGLYCLDSLDLGALLMVELGVALLCSVLGALAVYGVKSSLTPDGSLRVNAKAMLRFAWHMSGAQFLATLANPGLIRLVAGRALGVDAFVVFAFMQQIVLYTTRFLPSIQFANLVRPMLVARHSVGANEVVQGVGGLLWKINALTAIALIGSIFVGGDVLFQILAGFEYEHGGLTLSLILLIPPLMAQENLASTLLQVYRQSSLVRRLSALAVLTPVSVVLGASMAGIWGAVGGLVLGTAAQSFATLWVAKHHGSGILLDVRGVQIAVAAAGIAGGSGLALNIDRLVNPTIAAGWSILVYLVILGLLLTRLLRPLTSREFNLIERLFPSRASWIKPLVRRNG